MRGPPLYHEKNLILLNDVKKVWTLTMHTIPGLLYDGMTSGGQFLENKNLQDLNYGTLRESLRLRLFLIVGAFWTISVAIIRWSSPLMYHAITDNQCNCRHYLAAEHRLSKQFKM